MPKDNSIQLNNTRLNTISKTINLFVNPSLFRQRFKKTITLENESSVLENNEPLVETDIPPWSDVLNMPKWSDVKDYIKDKETPLLLIDPNIIERKYIELTEQFPYADIYYAVKANPDPAIVKLLRENGSNFDIASIYELDEVLAQGVSPDKISYGNTIKKARDIKYAYDKGIRLFVCDSEDDLLKLRENAPDAKIFFRILVDGSESADWPLSKKFGASPEMIKELIKKSADFGMHPYGLSFHVGSQQNDPNQWDNAIKQCASIFKELKNDYGVNLQMINLGGGLPAQYKEKIPEINKYRDRIMKSIFENFPDGPPRIIMEPGRSMVGDSGILVSEVVMVSRKEIGENCDKWVYLDVGKFGGLPETMTAPGEKKESIHYDIYTEKKGPEEKVILAGPTCDSMDTIYEDTKISLPADIKSGDYVYIATTGAYTASYSSVKFNGFKPLETHILPTRMTLEKRSIFREIIRNTWNSNIFI